MRYRFTIALFAVICCIMLCLRSGRENSTDGQSGGISGDPGFVSSQSGSDQNSYSAERGLQFSPDEKFLQMHMNYSSKLQEILAQVDPVERSIEFCSMLKEWVNSDPEA